MAALNEKAVKEKVGKYRLLIEAAFDKIMIIPEKKDANFGKAVDMLIMAENYCKDAKHFEGKGDLLNALAAYSYAHAWLDAGVRLKLLDGKGDDRLFTLP